MKSVSKSVSLFALFLSIISASLLDTEVFGKDGAPSSGKGVVESISGPDSDGSVKIVIRDSYGTAHITFYDPWDPDSPVDTVELEELMNDLANKHTIYFEIGSGYFEFA